MVACCHKLAGMSACMRDAPSFHFRCLAYMGPHPATESSEAWADPEHANTSAAASSRPHKACKVVLCYTRARVNAKSRPARRRPNGAIDDVAEGWRQSPNLDADMQICTYTMEPRVVRRRARVRPHHRTLSLLDGLPGPCTGCRVEARLCALPWLVLCSPWPRFDGATLPRPP